MKRMNLRESTIADDENKTNSNAPVVQISDRDGALLVDYNYGMGRITLLGDPYVVANNGISLNETCSSGSTWLPVLMG